MTPPVLTFLLVGLLVRGPAEGAAAQKELNGTWQLVSLRHRGGDLIGYFGYQRPVVVIKDGRIGRMDATGGTTRPWATFRLHPGAKPKGIDLTAGGEKGTKGVYAVEGNRLTFCFACRGKARPKKLEPEPGGDEVVLVYERQRR